MLEKLKEQIENGSDEIKAVGEILMALCQTDAAAELVEQDLEKPELSLDKCFLTMRATARKKQKSGCYYMPQEEIERIIRKFYGIPEEKPEPPKAGRQVKTGIIDLADLLEL